MVPMVTLIGRGLRLANDIRQWLSALELENYADVFAQNGIDLRALSHLTEQDLKDIGARTT